MKIMKLFGADKMDQMKKKKNIYLNGNHKIAASQKEKRRRNIQRKSKAFGCKKGVFHQTFFKENQYSYSNI